MINYWTNLNDREKWLVGLGSLSTLIYLFYLVIYSPLTSATTEKEKQLKEKRETLLWMQQIKQQVPKSKLQTTSSSKLLTVIATELTQQTLQKFPYQLKQTSQGDIQLSFDAIPYKAFLAWLWQLNNNYALILKELAIEKTNTVGLVKLTVVIATKAP